MTTPAAARRDGARFGAHGVAASLSSVAQGASVFAKCDYIKRYPARKCYPPNLGAVDLRTALFRGGAPNREGGDAQRTLACLQRKGVGRVLILNNTEQNVSVEQEIGALTSLGLDYERIDVEAMFEQKRHGEEPLWRHVKERLLAGRVFLHCVWGADRTGALVARFRVEVQGWAQRDALAELVTYGWAMAGTLPHAELQPYQKQVLGYFDCPLSLYRPGEPAGTE